MVSLSHLQSSSESPKRAPTALVVRNPPPGRVGAEVDWTRWYVTDEDDIGESPEQQLTIKLFLACLEALAEERQWSNTFAGADAFFAWVPEHPLVRVSPDVFLLDDPPPRPFPRRFQTWRPGHRAPRFALEVVSLDWRKDYEDGPERYAQLGCRELVIFDPEATDGDDDRRALTVFRRDADGVFSQAYSGPGPAYSAELEAWLVIARDHDELPSVRIARNAERTELVPTRAERAEARVRELEAELARLKSGR